jgi:serine/threonine protein kinase
VYQIHGDLLKEQFSSDRCVVRRQARGLQLVPTRRADDGYVWLRQVEANRDSPVARTALQALAREKELLRRLGSVRGLPRVHKFVRESRSATLVTGWPTSRSGAPCDTLADLLGRDGIPLDAWRVFRLCTGLAELSITLAKLHDKNVAHRYLTPAGIIMLGDGRLVLRDLGLATQHPEPGEGPADYQAPEQRRRSYRRPGPRADVYQLAAVAYHLLVGRPPDAGLPLPVRAQVPHVPERISSAVDAALAQAPNGRPCIRSLGATLRAARDGLS